MFAFISDYVLNGRPTGPIASALARVHYEPGLMRPFIEDHPNHPFRGQRCVVINSGQYRYNEKTHQEEPVRKEYRIVDLQARDIHSPVFNATTLPKETWLRIDQAVIRPSRYRLRAWADLAKESSYGGFNGMATKILEQEAISDPGSAAMDMTGLTDLTNDAPLWQLRGVPLAITHSKFEIDQRTLVSSQASGRPISVINAETSGRRIAEMIEKTLIGNQNSIFLYGGLSTQVGGYDIPSAIYGYTNYPNRQIYTGIRAPNGVGWSPDMTLADMLACRQLLYNSKFYGPFMAYHSNDWDNYLDNDYYKLLTSGAVAPTKSLRTRLKEIEDIRDVRRLDFLFSSPPGTNSGLGIQPGGTTSVYGAIVFTGTTTANNTSLSCGNTTGLAVGQLIRGPGVQSGTTITAISANTSVTLSANATSANANATFSTQGFQGPGGEGVSSSGNPFTFLIVQMTPDVVQAVNGMDITTIQYEEKGGMLLVFQVLCIQVPRIQSDIYGNCGILQATTS